MLVYTIGEVIDRLAITNLKLWHLEEQMADASLSKEDKGRISEDIVLLNDLRCKCIEAIDEFFAQRGYKQNG